MSKIRDLFTSGQVQKVYKAYLKNDFSMSEDFTWILGALCFLGKKDEAWSFSRKKKLNSNHYFFLTLAYIRSSDFKKTKLMIGELKKLTFHNESKAENLFFYYQALAIYSYYRSRYRVCLSFVKKSHSLSFNLEENFWKILAIDLLGHTLVQMGEVHNGISTLEDAHELAKQLGNKTFKEAGEISILNYKAYYSNEPKVLISTIEKKLRSIARNDNYSEGSLTLSLSHLHLLTGEMEKALKILTNSQKIIFQASTPRHKALWFFEKSYYHFLLGQFDLSLNLLDEAIILVDPENEKKLSLKILGLKRQIIALQGKNTQDIDRELIKLTQKVGDPQAINKLARLNLALNEVTEDPLQNIFDQYFFEKSKSEIIEIGYYGILRSNFLERSSQKEQSVLLTGLWKNGILIITPKTILVRKSGISSLLISTLILLSSKKYVTKENLLSSIWGYEYDPIRHDTLIYGLIHRLRGALGPLEKGLVGENHQYSLQYHFKHIDLSTELMPKKSTSENLPAPFKKEANWNIRQVRVLSLINKGQAFKVSDYATTFNVSLMTALRDLKELQTSNLINVYGKGRATTYAL
jgi:tetratricopeptide (TPR) repeat protein